MGRAAVCGVSNTGENCYLNPRFWHELSNKHANATHAIVRASRANNLLLAKDQRKNTLHMRGRVAAHGDSSHTAPHFTRPDLPQLSEDESARGCSCARRN